jgi:hypothetical protein
MKNRFALILISFLLITWFTPVILHDNIASAFTYYTYYDFKYPVRRCDSAHYTFGLEDYIYYGVEADSNFIYTTALGSDGRPSGLLVYNSTTHNLITYANESGINYAKVWVNGNYIFVTRGTSGLCAYYFDDVGYTLTYLDGINDTGDDRVSLQEVTGYSNYVFACGSRSSPDWNHLKAYSFDYGGSDTFTWINDYNVSSPMYIVSLDTDGTYIYTGGWYLTNGINVFSFDGATFTLEDTINTGEAVFDIYEDNVSGLIYIANRNSGIKVYSFIGASLLLEYVRDDGQTPLKITGNDTMIFSDGISGVGAPSELWCFTKYGTIMSLLETYVYNSDTTSLYDICAVQDHCFVVTNRGLYTSDLVPYLTPQATTYNATSVTTTTATLHGTVDYNGGWDFTSYGFQYGLTLSYEKGYVLGSDLQEYLDQTSTINDIPYTDIGGDGNGNLFATCGDNGLYVYSFDGQSFTLQDTIDDGGTYIGIYVGNHSTPYGKYIFVANGGTGLRAYKYNLSGLTLLSTIDDGGTYNGVWRNETSGVIYTACGASGIRAYTFNGTGFTLVTTRFDGTQDYVDVCENPNGVYASCGTEGLRAYTYAGGAFTPHGSSYFGTSTYGRLYPRTLNTFAGSQNYIFVANNDDGFLTYDFNGIVLTPRTTNYDGTGAYLDVWSDGIYAYTACSDEGIRAYVFDGTNFYLRATRYDGTVSDYNSVWGDNETNIFTATIADGISSYQRMNNGSYTYNLAGLTQNTVYHYRAFTNNSYDTGYGADMLLYTSTVGGVPLDLNINVYNESNGSQGIPFSVMVKNQNGSQVFTLLNQNVTCHFNTSAISGNQTVLIKVWSLEYRERIISVLVGSSLTANYTFYLPREIMPYGADPGGGSGYAPNSNITPFIYNLRVVETMRTEYAEFDRPIKDAWINVSRYINATGKYEVMSVLVTDTNGMANLYLIPSVLYLFNINAPLFDTMTADWNPAPPIIYQQTEIKIFRLTRTGQSVTPVNLSYLMRNITYSLEPLESRRQGPITFWYNITSTDGLLEWYRMEVYFYNQSNNTWVLLDSQNESNANGGSINYTTANVTGAYKVDVYFKKVGYNEFQIYQAGSVHYTIYYLPLWIRQIPDFVWYLIIVVLMIMGMGFCFTVLQAGLLTGYIGLGIFAFGLLLKPDLMVNGFSGWIIWTITFIIYTMGLFLWSRL